MADARTTLDGPKNLRVTQRLAHDLIRRPVGERLLTSREYQTEFEAGSGTISKGLRTLEDVGAVALRPRGHQGTFVTAKHIGRLWAIAELGTVIALLPAPLPSRSEELTLDLRERFDALGVPLQVIWQRGAEQRVRRVVAGEADLAMISGGAFERAGGAGRDERLRAWPLSSFTYYRDDSLRALLRPGLGSEREIRRIGVAMDSRDHARFSRCEFGDEVEAVEIEYDGLPLALVERRIDAALWHRVPLVIPLELVGIESRPLRRPEAIDLARSLSNAVVVARADAADLAAVLEESGVDSIVATGSPPRTARAA